MKFETEYKNIQFLITLSDDLYSDVTMLMGDKFHRLGNQTVLGLKKGTLKPYNVIIESSLNDESYTHYLSGIILTSDGTDVAEDLQDYLEQESVFDEIAELIKTYSIAPGPKWRVE